MLLCRQAAAALAASVTTVATAVMACTGLTVSQHAPHSSVHVVVDLWLQLNSRTARHYSSLIVTVCCYKPMFEQWRMAAGDEYPVHIIVNRYLTVVQRCSIQTCKVIDNSSSFEQTKLLKQHLWHAETWIFINNSS